jgi:tetratricopeptide (TPR) repeat protein
VALSCEQFPLARQAAARWRTLEPNSSNADLAAAIIALKRYDLEEARAALTEWRDSGSAGNQDPLRFAELLQRETDATAAYRVFGDVLATSDPTAEVLLAQSRLALAAYDLKRAVEFADAALALQSQMTEARLAKARAQALLGDTEPALAAARELADGLAGEDRFLVADVLLAGGRSDAARTELMRLRELPDFAMAADRRLGLLALEQGDEAEAEMRFSEMLGQRGSTGLGLFYLGQLAERRGDDAKALQNYRQLVDTTMALSVRSTAARLMLRHGDRKGALALLDDRLREHPEDRIEIAGLRAHLLAEHGDGDAAVAGIDETIRAYPGHPGLAYQRATVLERAGRSGQAIAAFEALYRERPEDPGIANALGFTLADHKRSLARAERLVRQALGVSPDNPAIQDSLGWVLFRQGKPRDAAPVLETAWRTGRDPEIAAHYGEVLWVLGDEGRARYTWAQALNLDPGNEAVRATQARLTGEPAAKR